MHEVEFWNSFKKGKFILHLLEADWKQFKLVAAKHGVPWVVRTSKEYFDPFEHEMNCSQIRPQGVWLRYIDEQDGCLLYTPSSNPNMSYLGANIDKVIDWRGVKYD